VTEADRGEELSPRAVPDQGQQPAAKHTPGPWQVGTPGYGEPGYIYCDNALGSAVAITYGLPLALSVFSRAEEEANARLIAAAPDLLEALKAVTPPHRALGCWCSYSRDTEGYGHEDGCKLARAAIAAAEGRTNG
jgi:hypothetical protein